MDKYELGSLSKLFGEHAEKAKVENEAHVKVFREQWPGHKLPDHLSDDFCLPVALKRMVDELMVVKEHLRALEDVFLRQMLMSMPSRLEGGEDDSTGSDT